VLKKTPSAEVRRSGQELMDQWNRQGLSPDVRQRLRAVAVLELIGTAEARRVLKNLADNQERTPWGKAAKASLGRLEMKE
jgi:hypothetical protein